MIPLRPLAWLVNLVLLGAVSYSAAALSMQALQRRLEAAAPAAVSAGRQAEVQQELAKLPIGAFQPVLDANIFHAQRSEVKRAPEAAPGLQQAAATAPLAQPLQVTLTGTMTMDERSFAMVADASGRNEQVYRLWDCLPAGEDHPTRNCAPSQGKLVSVRHKFILVRYQGERVKFELAAKPTAAAAPPPRPQVVQRPAQPGAPMANTDASMAPFPITQSGNSLDVRVPNAEVAKAFENFSEVLKAARVVPYTDETGQGFQIRNIRPGSIFARIGLSDFDKIKAVNGEPITTADQALRLLTMFRNEKQISLELERGSQTMNLNYTIE